MNRCLVAFALIILLVPGTVSADPEKTFVLPGDAEIEMVWIEPGTFMMGSPEDEPGRWENEDPLHEVTITRGFWLGKYELTQGQWESVMGTSPWVGQTTGGRVEHQEGPNYPAVYISWDDVQEFIGKLNDAEGSEVYRFPTEAEWEHAGRAGTQTAWSFGDDKEQLDQYGWYNKNTVFVQERYAHAVGLKLPNPWGLHDMHGNVMEWCLDWTKGGKYPDGPQTDPMGDPTGTERAMRSYDFTRVDIWTRSAIRGWGPTDHSSARNGARLFRTGPAPAATTVSPTSWGQIKIESR